MTDRLALRSPESRFKHKSHTARLPLPNRACSTMGAVGGLVPRHSLTRSAFLALNPIGKAYDFTAFEITLRKHALSTSTTLKAQSLESRDTGNKDDMGQPLLSVHR